jgi:hypothetical protein
MILTVREVREVRVAKKNLRRIRVQLQMYHKIKALRMRSLAHAKR